MSLSVKEILNIGKRHLEEAQIADAAIDCKLLYCYLMNITSAQLILEYQKVLPDRLCDEYFALLDRRAEGIPAIDCKLLYCYLMNITSAQLILEYQKVLPDRLCDEYFALLDRRAEGIPLQHITGVQEFMGLEFKVSDKVLIPRQDTETLVEDAIEIIEKNTLRGEPVLAKAKKDWDILDLCCGSGAIGLSLAKLCRNVKVTCADISGDALAVARENREKLSAGKVDFQQGNLLEPFRGRFRNKKFDMIISNPPYIESEVIPTLQREVRDHEPMEALDGGADGLDFYRAIVSDAADWIFTGRLFPMRQIV